jgi:hypothetical protein
MAVLLESRLAAAFGAKAVFRDDRAILLGTDFEQRIREELATCQVMLVVIGPQWLAVDADKRTKLDDESDWVRYEITEALRAGMHVAPLLVNGSARLDAAKLPEPLRPLTKRQYRYIRERSAMHDIEALVEEIAELIGQQPADPNAPTPTSMSFHEPVNNSGIIMSGNHNDARQTFHSMPKPQERADG